MIWVGYKYWNQGTLPVPYLESPVDINCATLLVLRVTSYHLVFACFSAVSIQSSGRTGSAAYQDSLAAIR